MYNDIEKTFEDALALVKKKNQDYAINDDPFSNFRNEELGMSVESEWEGVSVELDPVELTVELAILARVLDIIRDVAYCIDEDTDDKILDAINYLAILRAYIKKGDYM